MGRIFFSVLVLLISCQFSFAKQVDVNAAKSAGYNFCKSQGGKVGLDAFSLIYTATAVVNGNQVNDFYIFNTGTNGFVIVAADDHIVPVLAYSTESSFKPGYFPSEIKWWLNNYAVQINNVIGHNTAAQASTTIQWSELGQAQPARAAKTTGVVYPLLTTLWNQEPFYNYLCPFDASAGANAVTGCVATAMAQVMKYWNWPKKGTGSNSYYAYGFGTLTADFGSTTYLWDSMPNTVGNNNPAVGNLMLQAGVSVDMNYGVSGSSAQVMNGGNSAVNCTQNALPGYFSYKSTLQGIGWGSYSDSEWVHIIQHELDMKRPVIYSGYGDSGGHCFVTDGYITYDRFHFNWGWGGYANGYYIVENLDPSDLTFNDGQAIIIGIEPDTVNTTGVKQIALNTALNVYPNPANTIVNIDFTGTKATSIRIMDAVGRLVTQKTPAAGTTVETIAVSNFADGDYIVEIQTATGTITRKIVIAR
jgi:hypothetical protein